MLRIHSSAKIESNIWQIHLKTKNKNMETLKYAIIKTEEQYIKYCSILEELLLMENSVFEDEIELLTLLIEKWDNEHNTFNELNPVELIKSLMEENNLKAVDLVKILGLSKGTISKILNYHKGLSKETIRRLSEHFKVSQEAFNRPYELVNEVNRHFRDANLMNTKKDLGSTIAM
jgi:HTH-type transcriptional regulator/antitoxin HigA